MILKDRVKQITSTEGTGTITLGGTPNGFQSFADVFASGDSTYFCIENGADWEVGTGTYGVDGPNTLARDSVLDSSTGSKINLSGRSTVFVTLPAAKIAHLDDLGELNLSLETMDDVSLTAPASGEVLTYNGTEWANLVLPVSYTNEDAQDAVGGILVDSSSVVFTYDDATPSISAVVPSGGIVDDMLASGIASTKLSGLVEPDVLGSGTPDATTYLRGDQSWSPIDLSSYVAGPAGAVTDNAVVRWDTTTGRLVKNSGVTISDSGVVSASTLQLQSSGPGNSGSMYLSSSGAIGFDRGSYISDAVNFRWQLFLNGQAASLQLGQSHQVGWTNSVYATQGSVDAGVSRSSAGVVTVTNGSTGYGSLLLTAASPTTIPLTVKAAASQTANLTEWQNNAGVVGARITAAMKFSNATGGNQCEEFGDGASAANNGTAFGYGATATGQFYPTAFGHGALATSTYSSTAFGHYARAVGQYSTAVGDGSYAYGNYTTCLGTSTNSYYNSNTCVGNGSIATGTNQFVAGSAVATMSNVYFGKGITHATPTSYTINGTGGAGTNIAGASIVIAGGQGTGTGAGGSFKVQVAPAGASGSSANALVDALTIDSTKLATFEGDGYFNSGGNFSTVGIKSNGNGNGYLYFGGYGAGLQYGIGGGGNTATTYLKAGFVTFLQGSATKAYLIQSQVTATSSTEIGFTVKAAASQTANLTEWQSNAGVVGARVTAAMEFSNPGPTYAKAEKFGAGASVLNTGGAAFGADSRAGLHSTASGRQAVADGNYTNVVGTYTYGIYANCNLFGYSSTAYGASASAFGHGTNVHASSSVFGDGSASTAANQFVCGSTSSPINNVYFGKGVTNATPTAYTINGTGGSGTDIAGANIVIAGGKGTGTGAGGSFKVQVAPAGASGSSANALVDALTIDSTKYATINGNMTVGFGIGESSSIYLYNGNVKIQRAATAKLQLGSWYGDPSSNVEIYAGGFERIRVTGAGLVGINETSPGAQLQVTAGASTTIGQIIKLAASHTANALEVQDNTGTVGLAVDSAFAIQSVQASGAKTFFKHKTAGLDCASISTNNGYDLAIKPYITSDLYLGDNGSGNGHSTFIYGGKAYLAKPLVTNAIKITAASRYGVYTASEFEVQAATHILFTGTGTVDYTATAVIRQPTVSIDSGSGTVTDASALRIEAAPLAGTGMTLTNSWALHVVSGASKFGGAVTFSGAVAPASLADASAPNNSVYYSTDASKLVYKDSGGTVNNLY